MPPIANIVLQSQGGTGMTKICLKLIGKPLTCLVLESVPESCLKLARISFVSWPVT